MSLLLDARKKIELALRHSNAHKEDSAPQPAGKLSIGDLPAGVELSTPLPAPKPPEGRVSGGIPYTGARSDPRATGQNLFAAKAAPTGSMRLGIIPIAIISGLILAAGGGYYVWREISPPPMQRQAPASPPATPIAKAAPPAALVAQVTPAPASPAAKSTHAQAKANMKQGDRAPVITTAILAAPHNTTAQPIHIEHTQESNAVDPALLAAYQAYRNGDLRTAWQHYDDILHRDAKNRDALLGMAAIAQQQSQDDLAARYYGQVLILDPRDPLANAGMSALLGTSDETNTESRLKLLLAQQPHSTDTRPAATQSAALYFALGNLYAEQSRWGDAQQAYFSAYNLEQSNAQVAFNLAVSLDHLGQGKLAAQHYQRALQLDQSNNAGFNRAQTQQRINELTAP